MKLIDNNEAIWSAIFNSCDNVKSEVYHVGCHPALYLVRLNDGTQGIRCYDCLDGEAKIEIDKEFNLPLGI